MPSFPFFRERTQKHEWIGGRYSFPIEVKDGKDVVRPACVLWMEMPERVLVGSKAFDPRVPAPLVETLDEAMSMPVEGPPRRPSRIRVPDEEMARELRSVFRGIPVIVAPVPELDETFDEISKAANRQANPSYLGGGATPEIVGKLFAAAIALFRAAPWRHIDDQQIIAVDIPAFGIRDACLSVIGSDGEPFGLLLFRSTKDFWSFTLDLETEDGDADSEDGVVKDDVAVCSLTFDHKKKIPHSLMREIREHAWPVAGVRGYPAFICLDSSMNHLEATERDFRIMTALVHAFVPFYERHGRLFDEEEPEEVVFSSDGEVEVTLTAPHPRLLDEAPRFDEEDDSSFDDDPFEEPQIRITPPVGRNDPCPCGSGKKYKKCHGAPSAAPETAR